MEPDCPGWRSCVTAEGLTRIHPHGFALTRIRGGGGPGILFPDRLHGKPHLKGMTLMETEIYGDEDVEFDDAPEDD